MSMCGIYCIENIQNHQRYIGSSMNLVARWGFHRRSLAKGVHHNQHLQRAWQKYGSDSFSFSILITCAKDMLVYYEQQFLDQVKPEYNIYTKAYSPAGFRQSHEAKLKVSAARKGKPLSEEHKQKLRLAKLGTHHESRPVSLITRKKISEALKLLGIRPPSQKGKKLPRKVHTL